MNKIEFARKWYDIGRCPGCGASLHKTAGQELHHLKGDQPMSYRFCRSGAGDPIGSISTDDPRVCSWTGDELAMLVHIGSGLVGSHTR